MGYIILIIAVALAVCINISNTSQKGCGIKCFSRSCRYNRGGRCGRHEVTIYDNTVTGLCLHHTESMKRRVVEPILKSELFDKGESQAYVAVGSLKKAQESILDEKLLKDSRAFAAWMRKQSKLN